MYIIAMWPIRQGDPDWVNDDTPYPIAKGVWDSFSQNIVRAIDIHVETPPTEDRCRIGRIVDPEWIPVKDARFTGRALFAHHDRDADQRRLVLEHRAEARRRREDDVLVGPFPQPNRLFLAVVLADHQRADAL